MPQTPGIPNQAGVFGLGGGYDDPQFQYDMPGIQEGVLNLYSQVPGVGTLPSWRQAFTPGGPLKILLCGDSIIQGFGFGGDVLPASHRIGKMLRGLHGLSDGGIGLMLPAWSGQAGSGVTSGGTPQPNNLTGMGIASTARIINGADTYTFNTNNVTFTDGSKVCQSMDLLYIDFGAFNGDIQYKIDGGATQTLVTAKVGDYAVKSVRIPSGVGPVGLSNAVHSIQILGNGGLGVSFVGAIAYAGTNGPSGVQIYNAGVGGVTSLDCAGSNTTNAARATDFINVIQPHLSIIQVGINDIASAAVRTLANFKTNYTTLGFACRFWGDAIFVTPPQLNPNWSSSFPQYFSQSDLETAIVSIGAGFYNSPVLSLRSVWGNWGECNGVTIGDSIVHPNEAGQRDIANRIYKIMMMG